MTNDNSANDPIAYLDTGIIIALSISDDMHHDDASRVCNAAVRSNCVLITSYLAIMEAVGVVRKNAITLCRRRSGGEDEQASVEAYADAAVTDMLNNVDRMAGQDLLKIVKQKDRSPDLPLLCDKAIEHRGHAACGAKSGAYRHYGIGSYDLLHYSFAMAAGASLILTSDAAFADIEGNDNEFGHIRIRITARPLIDLLAGGKAVVRGGSDA